MTGQRFVLATLLCLLPAVSHAQVSEQARQAVADAQALYEANRFEEAGAAFEAAYDVTAHPSMIYNAYVAYRDAGLPREALRTLRRHLQLIAANDPERPRLEARLRGLEQQVAALDRGGPREQPGPTETTDEDAAAPQVDSGPDLTGPIVLLSVGGAALVAGAVMGGVTMAEHDAFVADCAPEGCGELAAEASRGQALALASDVVLAAGGAIAVAGLVWLIVSATSAPEQASAAMRCGPRGCGVAF